MVMFQVRLLRETLVILAYDLSFYVLFTLPRPLSKDDALTQFETGDIQIQFFPI